LSIKPEFVEKIFKGTKRFELRRSIFASTVRTVVIYATAPVGKVVGEFRVGIVHRASPRLLWQAVDGTAGIDRKQFTAYFDGCEVGHAIEIAGTKKYLKTLPIDRFASRPPQSFLYLK
jgi:predicted transcriptional regulator